jgi:hypothetical protein
MAGDNTAAASPPLEAGDIASPAMLSPCSGGLMRTWTATVSRKGRSELGCRPQSGGGKLANWPFRTQGIFLLSPGRYGPART